MTSCKKPSRKSMERFEGEELLGVLFSPTGPLLARGVADHVGRALLAFRGRALMRAFNLAARICGA